MLAGVIAGTMLQFVGALYVREYAKALWMREVREETVLIRTIERRSMCEDRGLPVIDESVERDLEEKGLL